LQALPFALIAGGIYAFFRFRRGAPSLPTSRKLASVLFVCYLSGLVLLTLLIRPLGALWYRLLYGMPSGMDMRFFEWSFNFVPSVFTYLGGDGFGNILLFLPFGVLYPLAKIDADFLRTISAGILCSLAIELLQPVFGRAFDVNDIILNALGTAVSAAAFFLCRRLFCNEK